MWRSKWHTFILPGCRNSRGTSASSSALVESIRLIVRRTSSCSRHQVAGTRHKTLQTHHKTPHHHTDRIDPQDLGRRLRSLRRCLLLQDLRLRFLGPLRLKKYSARLSKSRIGSPCLITLAYGIAVSHYQTPLTPLSSLGSELGLIGTGHKSIVRVKTRVFCTQPMQQCMPMCPCVSAAVYTPRALEYLVP